MFCGFNVLGQGSHFQGCKLNLEIISPALTVGCNSSLLRDMSEATLQLGSPQMGHGTPRRVGLPVFSLNPRTVSKKDAGTETITLLLNPLPHEFGSGRVLERMASGHQAYIQCGT